MYIKTIEISQLQVLSL